MVPGLEGTVILTVVKAEVTQVSSTESWSNITSLTWFSSFTF